MNNIRLAIFIVPLIAFGLVCILYFSFLKKSIDRRTFNKFILSTSILSIVLNFSWEVIQIPLYKNPAYDFKHIAFCALATLADVLMVLLLYFGLALMFKNLFWIHPLKFYRVVILVLIGGAGAVLAEMRHLSFGSWAYDNSMPIIPFVNVGMTPVLQFMILPLLIYYLSFKYLKSIG